MGNALLSIAVQAAETVVPALPKAAGVVETASGESINTGIWTLVVLLVTT